MNYAYWSERHEKKNPTITVNTIAVFHFQSMPSGWIFTDQYSEIEICTCCLETALADYVFALLCPHQRTRQRRSGTEIWPPRAWACGSQLKTKKYKNLNPTLSSRCKALPCYSMTLLNGKYFPFESGFLQEDTKATSGLLGHQNVFSATFSHVNGTMEYYTSKL